MKLPRTVKTTPPQQISSMTSVRALRQQRAGSETGTEVDAASPRRDRRRARFTPAPGSRPQPRTYEEARRTVPEASIDPAVLKRVRNGAMDMTEAMVRTMIAQGFPLQQARNLADIAQALDDAPARGPDREGPRLWQRGNGRIYAVYGSGQNKIQESSRQTAREGEHFSKHAGALAHLARFTERLVQETLRRVVGGAVTMSEVFLIYLRDHEPSDRGSDEEWYKYHDDEATCESLEEYMGETVYADLDGDVGLKYAKFRTGEQVKSQSSDVEDPEEIKYVQLVTARGHVDLLTRIVAYVAGKRNMVLKAIKKPRVPRRETMWLTADQWMRLFLAARGWMFDEDGRYVGYDRAMRDRFEPVLRFIMFYTFGGSRHGSILELLWAQDLFRGHVDAARAEIKRQGTLSGISNKRRGTSRMFGSLVHLAVTWCDRDAAKRGKSRQRYVHVVHNEKGLPYRTTLRHLFVEVKERAGLFWVTPHHLKHSGVTYAATAGMSMRQCSRAFSTSMYTLERTYMHLHDTWNKISTTFDESKLRLRNLRKLTSPSAEKFYGGVLPLPDPRSRGTRARLPLARPMTTEANRIYRRRATAAE